MKRAILSTQTILIVCAALLLIGCAGKRKDSEAHEATGDRGLYVWTDTENLLDLAEQAGVGEVCLATSGLNHTPTAKDVKKQKKTVKKLSQAGIESYYLCGDPAWTAEEMTAAVEAVAEYNEEVDEGERFTGIMLDCEAYSIEGWSGQDWYASLHEAKMVADAKSLELVINIPAWLEDSLLESLIADCCSSVAVMNYTRGEEVENIKEEYRLAGLYGKELICVSEVESFNSEAEIERTWDAVKEAYPDVKFAFHHAGTLKEILN